jgi:hypothetical protein
MKQNLNQRITSTARKSKIIKRKLKLQQQQQLRFKGNLAAKDEKIL